MKNYLQIKDRPYQITSTINEAFEAMSNHATSQWGLYNGNKYIEIYSATEEPSTKFTKMVKSICSNDQNAQKCAGDQPLFQEICSALIPQLTQDLNLRVDQINDQASLLQKFTDGGANGVYGSFEQYIEYCNDNISKARAALDSASQCATGESYSHEGTSFFSSLAVVPFPEMQVLPDNIFESIHY